MKLRLDNEYLECDFFEGSRLLGIVAPVKGYRFCWQLNRQMRLDFRITNQIEIKLAKKNREYFFTVYECVQPNKTLVHYLYNNQNDGEYLLPEFRHLDFFWLLKGDSVSDELMNELLGNIRSITGVQLVTELTQTKIKHREHLIF
ncbi:MAG: IPExxxVDY family protein [Bacteroidota bacterium]|nr:IPExxxVDY family protein [Bacteroidota bacterium]MDP4212497.1 IPExxxVDY family protein [Bacteroidota bacterium]MDP4248906.1 IPExxxVDY family protein [Bacteroidota bacterium]